MKLQRSAKTKQRADRADEGANRSDDTTKEQSDENRNDRRDGERFFQRPARTRSNRTARACRSPEHRQIGGGESADTPIDECLRGTTKKAGTDEYGDKGDDDEKEVEDDVLRHEIELVSKLNGIETADHD